MIKICFRFDDPSEISDHDLENKIIDLFVKYDAKICLAVIPFRKKWRDESEKIYPLSAQKVPHIIEGIQNGTVEITQHGYSHVSVVQTAKNHASEFSGVDFAQQEQKIITGRQHLAEVFKIPIKGFVPPFNTYDKYTLEILTKQKFSYISAGWNTPNNHIVNLPRTCNLSSVETAIVEAQKFKKLLPIINVVLHHDEFEEHIHANRPDNPTPFTNLSQLEALLNKIKQSSHLENCHISEICQTNQQIQNNNHFSNYNWTKHTHWRIRPYFPGHLILTNSKSKIAFEIAKQAIHR